MPFSALILISEELKQKFLENNVSGTSYREAALEIFNF